MAKKMTLGEYKVGIDFNPSGDDLVGRIKRASADLVDLISEIDNRADEIGGADDADVDDQIARWEAVMDLKDRAMVRVEEAAMWAVKAATKPLPKGW